MSKPYGLKKKKKAKDSKVFLASLVNYIQSINCVEMGHNQGEGYLKRGAEAEPWDWTWTKQEQRDTPGGI